MRPHGRHASRDTGNARPRVHASKAGETMDVPFVLRKPPANSAISHAVSKIGGASSFSSLNKFGSFATGSSAARSDTGASQTSRPALPAQTRENRAPKSSNERVRATSSSQPQPAKVSEVAAAAVKRAAAAAQWNVLNEPAARKRFLEQIAERQKARKTSAEATTALQTTRTFVPWAQYAPSIGKPVGTGGGQKLLLLAEPWVAPIEWVPRVNGLRSEQKALQKRAVEALRLAPALTTASWVHILDEPAALLARWEPDALVCAQLDALCALAGHDRLAAIRRQICHLDAHLRRAYGTEPLACMSERVGRSRLESFLRERNEAAEVRALAQAARGQLDAAAADATEEAENGAAAAALSLLATAKRAFGLDWSVDHTGLDQYRSRPPAREDGGAADPGALYALHCELVAADPGTNEFVAGAAAMAALQMHTCLRSALAMRSRLPQPDEHGMAVGASGMDLKKGRWRIAGRPLICSMLGHSGSDAWYKRACRVLDTNEFNERHKSLIRAHNGIGGNPNKATAWLDREPTEGEWNATLSVVTAVPTRAPSASKPGKVKWRAVEPPLLRQNDGSLPNITKHSLKKVKIAVYAALRLHPDYMVEAGAHAGSVIERMSVAAMHDDVRRMRPSGLHVALGYARQALSESVAEVDYCAFQAVRLWISQTGLEKLPRHDTWRALSAWTHGRATLPEATPPLAP